MIKREATVDHSEDNFFHVADIHLLTRKNHDSVAMQRFHYHNYFEIMIVQRGEMTIMVNYMEKKLSQGSVTLLSNNLPHEITSFGGDYRVVIIHIPHEMLRWEMSRIPELAHDDHFMKESRCGYHYTQPRIFERVSALARQLNKNEGFLRISNLFEMLSVLSNAVVDERIVENWGNDTNAIGNKVDHSAVERAFAYIRSHYTEQLTLDNIANYANQNKTALCRSFRRTTGQSIFQYISRLRIERACELIRGTDRSITNIAYEVGYNTFSHFVNQFRTTMHTTPTAYRKE